MPTTLNLPAAPGTLPLQHLSQSNYSPLQIEKATLNATLHDTEQVYAEFLVTLKEAEARKADFEERILVLKKMLAPCRYIPLEIWSRIFCFVMEVEKLSRTRPSAYLDASYARRRRIISGQMAGQPRPIKPPPILTALSSVCRTWRNAVMSTPQLWTRLPSIERCNPEKASVTHQNSFYLQLTRAFDLYRTRSGALPLQLDTTFPISKSKPFYEAVSQTFPRVETLKLLFTSIEAVSSFASLPQQFDTLSTLEVTFSSNDDGEFIGDTPASHDLFTHSPCLYRLDLAVNLYSSPGIQPIFNHVHLPTQTITHLTLSNVNPVDFHIILLNAPNLVSVTYSNEHEYEGVEHTLLSLTPPQVVHNNIQTFILACRSGCVAPELDFLSFPKAISILLAIPRLNIRRVTIPSMFSSLTSLTGLDLAIGAWSGRDYVDMLRPMIQLTRLSIQYCHVFSQFASALCDRDIALLPRLTELLVSSTPSVFDKAEEYDALQRLAIVRCQEGIIPPSPSLSIEPLHLSLTLFTPLLYVSSETTREPDLGMLDCVGYFFYALDGWDFGYILPRQCPVFARLARTMDALAFLASELVDGSWPRAGLDASRQEEVRNQPSFIAHRQLS